MHEGLYNAPSRQEKSILSSSLFCLSIIASAPLIGMATLSLLRLLGLTWLALSGVVYSQSCFNQSTAINGKSFPPLIEATTEDLISGLESGLFTSVDLVTVSYSLASAIQLASDTP